MLIHPKTPTALAKLTSTQYVTIFPAAYGRDASGMAAMLIARCRQVLAEPEVWPSLLDDEELKTAYAAYRETRSLSTGGGEVLGGAAAAPGFGPQRLAAYIGWILGSGALQSKGRADDMRRRRMAVPS